MDSLVVLAAVAVLTAVEQQLAEVQPLQVKVMPVLAIME
jgi:hypothetical protein